MFVFLLHGWSGSAKSLQPLAKVLIQKGFNVQVLEMPGHGTTPQMDKAWSMRDFGLWLKSSIDQTGAKDYALVGHSFGGKLILEVTSSGLLKPKQIVLINANGIKPKNSFKKLFWKTSASVAKPLDKLRIGKLLKKFIYKYLIRESDYAKTSGNIRESFKLFNEEFYDDKLGKISIPTLIIWGKLDKVTPLWMGEKMHKGIKGSSFKTFDATHGLPLKQPDVVGEEIFKFLKQS